MSITTVAPDRAQSATCRSGQAYGIGWRAERLLRHDAPRQGGLSLRTDIAAREGLGFINVAGDSGASLWVSDNRGRGADYNESMRMLGDAGLWALDDHRALRILMDNKDLRIGLQDTWFCLRKAAPNSGFFVVLDDDYFQINRPWPRYAENSVYFSGGAETDGPVSLGINPDRTTRYHGWRYVVYSGNGPKDVMPVVVGVEKEDTQA